MKIIIFGNKEFAELANYYLTNDSNLSVECFSVHGKYMTENKFCNKDVIALEELEKSYSKDEYLIFAPIYENKNRIKIYQDIKCLGYNFYSYISSKANIFNSQIGENCFILENCNIQPFCKLKDNIVIWSCSHIGHHSIIESNNFISGNVTVAGHNHIMTNCFLGTSCTTRENITIAEGSLVGQSSSVTKNIEEKNKVWVGSPCKFLRDNF